MSPLFQVLHEDDHLLVVSKPAGLVCHPTKGDVYSSLISRLRLHRGEGVVRLVNRLDRETSGVTVAAKTAEAAGELGSLFEHRRVRKAYEAIVHGHPSDPCGVVDAPLGRAEGSPVAIQDAVRPDGAPSITRWRVGQRFEREGLPFAVVHLEPETGRKHQIRIHLAHLGHPIVGDKLYGGDPGCYLRLVEGRLGEEDRRRLRLPFQALHAGTLAFHWRGIDWEFQCPPEAWFLGFVAGEPTSPDWPDAPASGSVGT